MSTEARPAATSRCALHHGCDSWWQAGCAVPDPPFRLLDCSGQKIHGVANFGGCIPQNDTFMLDFQDFVNFLAGAPSSLTASVVNTNALMNVYCLKMVQVFEQEVSTACDSMPQSTTTAMVNASRTTLFGTRWPTGTGLMHLHLWTTSMESAHLTLTSGLICASLRL